MEEKGNKSSEQTAFLHQREMLLLPLWFSRGEFHTGQLQENSVGMQHPYSSEFDPVVDPHRRISSIPCPCLTTPRHQTLLFVLPRSFRAWKSEFWRNPQSMERMGKDNRAELTFSSWKVWIFVCTFRFSFHFCPEKGVRIGAAQGGLESPNLECPRLSVPGLGTGRVRHSWEGLFQPLGLWNVERRYVAFLDILDFEGWIHLTLR